MQVFLLHIISAFIPALAFSKPGEGWLAAIHYSPLFFLFDGYSAVYIFFVLSGYVLTRSFDKRPTSLTILYSSRVVRLAVPVCISVLFAYLLTLMFIGAPQQAASLNGSSWLADNHLGDLTITSAIWDAFIVAPFIGYGGGALPLFLNPPPLSTAYNAPMWTLSIELYGAIMIYTLCAIRQKHKLIWGGIFAGLVILMFNMYLMPFLLGHILAYYKIAESKPKFSKPLTANLVALCLISLGIILCTRAEQFIFPFFTWACQPEVALLPQVSAFHMQKIYGACLIFIGITQSTWLRRQLDRPKLISLGAYSFALYLCHWAIIFGPGTAAMAVSAQYVELFAASLIGICVTVVCTAAATHIFKSVDDLAIHMTKAAKVLMSAPRQPRNKVDLKC